MKKSESDVRNVIMSFRCTMAEKEKINERALSSYRIPSEYIRDCALGKDITVIPGIESITTELQRIGNNLNQLTRAVNGGILHAADLGEMRKEVARIWQSLNSLQRAVR